MNITANACCAFECHLRFAGAHRGHAAGTVLANRRLLGLVIRKNLWLDAKQLCHLPILESFSGYVGLHPFSVDHELRNGPLARALDHFFGSAWSFFNIDLIVGNVILSEPALCDMAIPAPGSSIDS